MSGYKQARANKVSTTNKEELQRLKRQLKVSCHVLLGLKIEYCYEVKS